MTIEHYAHVIVLSESLVGIILVLLINIGKFSGYNTCPSHQYR